MGKTIGVQKLDKHKFDLIVWSNKMFVFYILQIIIWNYKQVKGYYSVNDQVMERFCFNFI